MTGNRRGPDDWSSDNPRPAASLADAGFSLSVAKTALKLVTNAESEAHRDYWTRVREEMRLRDGDLEWARTPVHERWQDNG